MTGKTQENIVRAIFDAMDEVHQQLSGTDWPAKASDTHLIGEEGRLDSLGFVNFVALVEESCEESFGIAVSLTEEAETRAADPFETVGTLADFIGSLLGAREHA